MSRRLMIDPPSGWKYGFPKYLNEDEGHQVLEMTLDEITDWLLDKGYPVELRGQAGWCRFMWVDRDPQN